MGVPVNANAEYIPIITRDKVTILIDMNDIAKLDELQIQPNDMPTDCKLINIFWKTPYSEPWQVLVKSNDLKLWTKFRSKVVKTD